MNDETDETETIYCLNPECDWIGDRFELVCTDEDPDNFVHCPICGGAETDDA